MLPSFGIHNSIARLVQQRELVTVAAAPHRADCCMEAGPCSTSQHTLHSPPPLYRRRSKPTSMPSCSLAHPGLSCLRGVPCSSASMSSSCEPVLTSSSSSFPSCTPPKQQTAVGIAYRMQRRHVMLRRAAAPSSDDGMPFEPQSLPSQPKQPDARAVAASQAARVQAEAAKRSFKQMASRGDWLSAALQAVSTGMELLGRLALWVLSCGEVLRQFSAPSPRQAVYRMGLVLAASLFLIVVVSTIDGGMLQLYIMGARRTT